jgi:hypothetical protein
MCHWLGMVDPTFTEVVYLERAEKLAHKSDHH